MDYYLKPPSTYLTCFQEKEMFHRKLDPCFMCAHTHIETMCAHTYVETMCAHMYVETMCTHMYVETMCAHMCIDTRSCPRLLFLGPFPSCFSEKISHWSEAHQVGWTDLATGLQGLNIAGLDSVPGFSHGHWGLNSGPCQPSFSPASSVTI